MPARIEPAGPRVIAACPFPQWPEWLTPAAMMRLQTLVGYQIREADGVQIAEPASGAGPAYVQDPETEWWRYVYDVAC